MKKTLLTLLPILLFLAVFTAGSVFAQPTTPPPGGTGGNPGDDSGSNPVKVIITLDNPFKVGDNLYDLAKAIVNNVILPIGGVLCVMAFIYAGFMYVTAGGDTSKIKNANNMLLYAAIGTAVLLGAWVLATAIQSTINQLVK